MEWSIYNHLYYSKKAKAHLLYSSLSNMIVELDKEGYKEILRVKDNPDNVDRENEIFRFLFEGRFLVDSNDTELNKLLLSTLQMRFDLSTLSLTIAPTRACNFACSYCYEKDRANIRMNKKIQQGILDFVKKQDMLKSLNVSWYGGEPTLSLSVIKFLSTELQKCVDNYSALMVTNGYHLDKVIDVLDELRIKSLQVTLDGTKETHDKTRHLLNGKGTFDKILKNLEKLLTKHTIPVSVRMNISTENSDQYAYLYQILRQKFANKVSLYPAFVHNYSGNCQVGTCYDDSYKKAFYLKNLFEDKGIYTKDLYPFRAPKGCMVQKLNAFVVGPEGDLYKCWHHLGVQEKVIGNILSPTTINNALLADVMLNKDCIFDDNCKKCILFPSCYGGCADIKNRNENVCIPAKSMLEDFLDIRYVVRTQGLNKI